MEYIRNNEYRQKELSYSDYLLFIHNVISRFSYALKLNKKYPNSTIISALMIETNFEVILSTLQEQNELCTEFGYFLEFQNARQWE